MALRGIAAKLALLFQKNETVMLQKKGRKRGQEPSLIMRVRTEQLMLYSVHK